MGRGEKEKGGWWKENEGKEVEEEEEEVDRWRAWAKSFPRDGKWNLIAGIVLVKRSN